MSGLRAVLSLLDVPWTRVARAVLLGALALGCSIGLAATSAWLIARASQMPPILTLSVAVAAVRAFGVGRGILRYAERLASHDVALRGMANLRANLYEQIAAAPANRLARLRRGDLLARVGVDVEEVGNLIVRSIVPAAVAAVLAVASVGFIWTILPTAACALAAALLLAGLLAPWLAYRATARSEWQLAAARAEVSADALHIAEDGQQLRVAGTLGARLADLRSAEDRLSAAAEANANGRGLANAVAVLAQSLAVIAALVFGAMALQPGGPLAGSDRGRVLLAVVVITPMAAFEALGTLPGAAIQLRRSQQAAERLSELLPGCAGVSGNFDKLNHPNQADMVNPTQPSSFCGPPAGAQNPQADSTASPASVQSIFSLRDVSVGWPDAPPLFTGIDLQLSPGETLAVVGPSGIGKTTLLMTMASLLPPMTGEVARADRALFVAEDDHIFGTTVLENLRVARGDVTPDEAASALSTAGLGRWLASLPDGLDTMLGPDATNVSGGERRRVLIARALLSPAKILLIDEPGEHLDPETADDVLAALLNHARAATERTVVIATHRPAEANRCDRVLHLSNDSAPGSLMRDTVAIQRTPSYQLPLSARGLGWHFGQ